MDHSDAPLVLTQEVKNKPFITFYYESTFTVTMAPKHQALNILKKGLNNFSKKQGSERHLDLEAITQRNHFFG